MTHKSGRSIPGQRRPPPIETRGGRKRQPVGLVLAFAAEESPFQLGGLSELGRVAAGLVERALAALKVVLASEVGREVMDPQDWVPVVLGNAVELPEVSTWTVAPPRLGYQVDE